MIHIPANAPLAQWLELTQNLLDSYHRWTNRELLERTSPEEELLALWNSPLVIVSHGTQADPAFVYGNHRALKLWEMSLDQFLGMPSRLTAEPLHTATNVNACSIKLASKVMSTTTEESVYRGPENAS